MSAGDATWQEYIDDLLGEGCFKSVAILGIECGSVWGESSGCTLTEEERKSIAKTMKKPEELIGSKEGMRAFQKKFIVLNAENDTATGKELSGGGGVVYMKTNQTILVGYSKDNALPSAVVAIGKMADYLKQANY